MKLMTPHFERINSARAFTLTEVMMAVVILSMIWLGMQSAMLLASRASPDRNGVNNSTLRSGLAMDQINADLSYAISINSSTANLIDFNVPDRTGNGVAETIRYSWTGVSGDPILRTINGGTATAVLTNVTQFQLTFDKRSTKIPASFSETAEQLLFTSDGGSSLSDFNIDSNNEIAEMITPTVPSNAAYWRITRVLFRAKTAGPSNGEMSVQVRPVGTSSKPATTIVDYGKLLETNLYSGYSWQTISFSNASGFAPGSGAYITFLWVTDAQAGTIQYRTDANFANATRAVSSDGGSTWNTDSSKGVVMYVYGTYATQNPDAYQYNLSDVRCQLRSGSDYQSGLSTTIRVLNEPTVTGP